MVLIIFFFTKEVIAVETSKAHGISAAAKLNLEKISNNPL